MIVDSHLILPAVMLLGGRRKLSKQKCFYFKGIFQHRLIYGLCEAPRIALNAASELVDGCRQRWQFSFCNELMR